MHRLSSNFILGYHGCDGAVAEYLLAGKDFVKSDNSYDWLGPGIYFWESNPKRAFSFAVEKSIRAKKLGKSFDPAVVGAVIDLGNCLDLTSEQSIQYVVDASNLLFDLSKIGETELPKNDNGEDKLFRSLDCAVIRMLHSMIEKSDEEQIDSVRGVFLEGEPIYPGAGFHNKTHIQVCVCNPLQIKGVFRVNQPSK